MTKSTATFLLGSILAALFPSEGSAQDECVCPVTPDTAEMDHTGSDDPALAPEQTQGSEPDDFEFEAPPSDGFDQQQTEGSEPDDFEFEAE